MSFMPRGEIARFQWENRQRFDPDSPLATIRNSRSKKNVEVASLKFKIYIVNYVQT